MSLLSVEEIAQDINQAQGRHCTTVPSGEKCIWLPKFNHMYYLEPSVTLFRVVQLGAVLNLFISGFDSFRATKYR